MNYSVYNINPRIVKRAMILPIILNMKFHFPTSFSPVCTSFILPSM